MSPNASSGAGTGDQITLLKEALAILFQMLEHLSLHIDRRFREERVLALAIDVLLVKKGLVTREELQDIESEVRAGLSVEDALCPTTEMMQAAIRKYESALRIALGEGPLDNQTGKPGV